ncbi:unnamed protein product [Schistocephalus solidus]|uniref:Uncharacterized protein n=1 Tax=Schistocephalus solidus TaxID=70667 RepID=A0A183T0N6_SCHSO|nr:unnamed protein product [Schistocephalus solidus]
MERKSTPWDLGSGSTLSNRTNVWGSHRIRMGSSPTAIPTAAWGTPVLPVGPAALPRLIFVDLFLLLLDLVYPPLLLQMLFPCPVYCKP